MFYWNKKEISVYCLQGAQEKKLLSCWQMPLGWNVSSLIKQIDTYKLAMTFLMNGKWVLNNVTVTSLLNQHCEVYFQSQNHQKSAELYW